MSTEDTSPEVIMVPVKRYDVTLSLDDILTPPPEPPAPPEEPTPPSA